MLADETAGYTSLLLRMGHPGVGSSGGEGARLSAPRLGRRALPAEAFFFFFIMRSCWILSLFFSFFLCLLRLSCVTFVPYSKYKILYHLIFDVKRILEAWRNCAWL